MPYMNSAAPVLKIIAQYAHLWDLTKRQKSSWKRGEMAANIMDHMYHNYKWRKVISQALLNSAEYSKAELAETQRNISFPVKS